MNSNNKHVYIVPLILIVVMLYIYMPSLMSGGYIIDDKSIVKDNYRIKSIKYVGDIFKTPYWLTADKSGKNAGIYRPITMVSFLANRILMGHSAENYRVVNLILHFINSLLVYMIMLYLFGRKNLVFTWASTLIYSIHPVNMESVFCIVGRAELLASLFILISVIFTEKKKYLLSSIFYLLAMLSKESSIFLIIFIAAYAILIKKLKYSSREFIKIIAMHSIPVIVVLTARWLVLGGVLVSGKAKFFFAGVSKIPTILNVIGKYMYNIILPNNLSIEYFKLYYTNHYSAGVVITALIMLAGAILLYKSRNLKLLTYALWPVIFILPTINIFFAIGRLNADRFLYTPMVGVVVLFAYAGHYVSGKYKKHAVYAKIIIVCFTFLIAYNARSRAKEFASEKLLIESEYSRFNNNEMLTSHLAQIYANEGKNGKAMYYANKTIEINDKILTMYIYIGELYLKEKDYANTIKSLNKARVMYKKYNTELDSNIYNNIAIAYYYSNKKIKALEELERGVAYIEKKGVTPRDYKLYKNYGKLLFEYKYYNKSEDALLKAMGLYKKDRSLYYLLAKLYDKTNDTYKLDMINKEYIMLFGGGDEKNTE